MSLDVKPSDLVGQGQDGSWKGHICKAICIESVEMGGEKLTKGQSWGFTSHSTARVILGQVLRIATCGTRTHRGDSL